MRVLIVVPWDQRNGGVASVVGNLGRQLDAAGHKVIYFVPGDRAVIQPGTSAWGLPKFELNIRKFVSPFDNLKQFLGFILFFPVVSFQLLRVVRKHRIDIINFHYPLPPFAYFVPFKWLLNVRLVTSIHGADLFPEGNVRQRFDFMTRILLSASDRIVAPSKRFLDEFLEVFPDLRSRSSYIHNGVDLDEIRSIPSVAKSPSPRPYCLTIANHGPKKALDILLLAFAEVIQQVDVDLLLIGDGPLRADLEGLAADLGISSRVHFLGERDRATTIGLLKSSTVFALPSRAEPFGIATVEAMTCNVPVVVTNVGGIPEIVDDHVNGIMVPADDSDALADGMKLLLLDKDLVNCLTSNAYVTATGHFTVKRNFEEYAMLFKGLLDKK